MAEPEYPRDLLALMALAATEMLEAMRQLDQNERTLDEWQAEMTRLLTRYAAAAALLGLGTLVLSEQAEQAVLDYVRGQVPFLQRFADQMAAGEWQSGREGRTAMYADSIQVVYWMARTRFLELPAYPGDGSSECLTNDRCMWVLDWLDEDAKDVDAYWLTEKDNAVCATCLQRGKNWFPLRIRKGLVPK